MPTGVDDVPTGNTYDKYATTNPIEQRMIRGFMAALDAMLDGLQPQRILEVGIGEGEVAMRVCERFPDAAFVGVDLPDETLATEWQQRSTPAMFSDVTALPFPDDTFDLVLAIEVLEHIREPRRALAEITRVGSHTIVVSVPFEPIWRIGNMARRRYVGDWGNTPGHVNHWTRWSFRRFIGSRCSVRAVRSPLPWTMVRATV